MSSGVNVLVHPSQFPDAVRRDLLQSLRTRRINHKFHYDSYKQAVKWLALHEAHSPARRDPACRSIYDQAFSEVASGLRRQRVQLVGLGCGGGQKEAALLRILAQRRIAVTRYVPVDVSLPLALVSSWNANGLVREKLIHPMVCDLAGADDLAGLVPRRDGALRLTTLFGILPNFEPRAILPLLAGFLYPDDRLLLSANLVPEPIDSGMRRLLGQYDNELTRDWLLTLLVDLGIDADDGELRFSIEKRGAPRFVARFKFSRARTITVHGTRLVFPQDTVIRLFFSYRYTPSLLARTLARYRMKVASSWIAPSGEEGVFLVKRA